MYTQCTGIIKFCYVNFEFIYSQFIFTEETLVYIFICFTCTKFFIYIWYRVMTTKTLFSICQHTVDPFTHFTHSLSPPVTTTATVFFVSTCLFLFGLFIYIFVYLFFVSYYKWNNTIFVFLHLTYFT